MGACIVKIAAMHVTIRTTYLEILGELIRRIDGSDEVTIHRSIGIIQTKERMRSNEK